MKLRCILTVLVILALCSCENYTIHDFGPEVTTYYVYANTTADEISVECFHVEVPENTFKLDSSFVIAPGKEHTLRFHACCATIADPFDWDNKPKSTYLTFSNGKKTYTQNLNDPYSRKELFNKRAYSETEVEDGYIYKYTFTDSLFTLIPK